MVSDVIENGVQLTNPPKNVIQESPFKGPPCTSPSTSNLQGLQLSLPKEYGWYNLGHNKPPKPRLKRGSLSHKLNKPSNGIPVARPKINDGVNVHHNSEKPTIPTKPISHPNEVTVNILYLL